MNRNAQNADDTSPDRRWQAVLDRSHGADAVFVYAVASTGIYCRPSCPSRRPRRDRVTFFDSAALAERAGYRACRRCDPRNPSHVDPWTERIRRACIYLSNGDGRVSLAKLARRVGGSPYHLQRSFKRMVGVSPREFADAARHRRVRRGLRACDTVTTAVFDAGYASSSRFYEGAAMKLGMTPSAYRKGGRGATIRHTIVDSPLGRLLVAATSRGVCSIALGASDRDLEHALSREYPEAEIARDDNSLKPWVRTVVTHLEGRQPRVELPLDVRATAFQWQVWLALAEIPYGETRSYTEVARAIGRPRAARAVARACATNPVAVAIPCHRVVPADGGFGGYRWGVARKKRLLETEQRSRPR